LELYGKYYVTCGVHELMNIHEKQALHAVDSRRRLSTAVDSRRRLSTVVDDCRQSSTAVDRQRSTAVDSLGENGP